MKDRSSGASDLAGEAYVIIRERILRGEVAIGQVISRRKIAAELGMSFLPVSYTHLDVYKRQEPGRSPCPIVRAAAIAASSTTRAISNAKCAAKCGCPLAGLRDLFCGDLVACPAIEADHSTPQDVYKRQGRDRCQMQRRYYHAR